MLISPLKNRVWLSLGVLLLLLISNALHAHAPENHDFDLVSFKKAFPAPSFSLKDLNGKTTTLENYRGQYVLLNFWATWCIPCLKEMPSMEQLHQKFKDQKFTVVAISIDTEPQQKVEGFVKKLKVNFPILLDPENESSDVYGVRSLPSTFLINPQGQVVAAAKGEREWFSEDALSYLEEWIHGLL